MKRPTPRLARRLGATLFVTAILTACTASADVGLPQKAFTTLDGGELVFSEPGHQRVVNLWATWCAPCRRELPVFDELAQELTSVEVIGVSVGDSPKQAQALVDELDLAFPQVLDPTAELRTSQRITGMPATIFVGVDGDVLGVHAGEVDRAELVELINQYFDAGLR